MEARANIICERSLIVIVGGSRLHKVRRGNVLSDLSGFKCPRSLMSAGTNIREQISRGKKMSNNTCMYFSVCLASMCGNKNVCEMLLSSFVGKLNGDNCEHNDRFAV